MWNLGWPAWQGTLLWWPKEKPVGPEKKSRWGDRGMFVPVDAAAVAYLPRGERQYTELEALFSLQLDYALGRPATIAGYAAQWRWGRDRVRAWLTRLGVEIVGQVGQRPGSLSAASQPPVSNQSATGQLIFYDFGRIGSNQSQQPVSRLPVASQRPGTPIYRHTNIHTVPDTVPDDENREKIRQYKEILSGKDNGELASRLAWPGESWEDFRGRLARDLARLQRAN